MVLSIFLADDSSSSGATAVASAAARRAPRQLHRRRLRQGLGRELAVTSRVSTCSHAPRASTDADASKMSSRARPLRSTARGPPRRSRRLTVLVEGPVQVRARPWPPQIHDRAGDRASLISIDRDPHPQPLAEVVRRRPRVPHDVARLTRSVRGRFGSCSPKSRRRGVGRSRGICTSSDLAPSATRERVRRHARRAGRVP